MKKEEVSEYIKQAKNWNEEMAVLREIILECGLDETYKWRAPCYTFQEKNLLMLGSFKAHCVISFFKGVLLKDEYHQLVKPGENSQSARFMKFTSIDTIHQQKDIIKAYIFEAIEIEKEGTKVEFKESKEFEIPEELNLKFLEMPELKTAFFKLTTGRQRAYIIHFTGSQQSKTRMGRIEKYIPRILNGKGFNDCVCGLSKKMPNCDGSHKMLEK